MFGKLAIAGVAIGLLATPLAARAETAIAVLDVHNARCDLCPLIVKNALKQTKGVESVEVGKPDSKGEMTANVVFDNAVTTAAVLSKAVTDHGYPTQVTKEMPAQAILNVKPMQ